MKQMYREQWLLFKENYWKFFVGIFFLFIVSSFSVYTVLLGETKLITDLMEQVMAIFEEKDILGPDTTNVEMAGKLFFNNLLACLFIFVSGFVPVYLPALFIVGLNGSMLGVMFAYLKMNGQALAPMFFAGIFPHGLFEIPAIILAGALAFYLSTGMYKKIAKSEFSFQQVLKNATVTFLSVCVPLLVIAALIEAFITPILLDMAM